VNDAKLFYDIIQRRRNGLNVSFCCGAGSIHRRDAVMNAALKSYSKDIDQQTQAYTKFIKRSIKQAEMLKTLRKELSVSTKITPYKFHVSEDIYTSIILHEDRNRNWKSVYHPHVETKMLSPLDIQSWAMQRIKYAGGSLDILFNDCPLFRKGMSIRKRLMYASTFWSYLAPLWNVVFIAAPLIALFTGLSPVNSYSIEFFAHLLPFLILHELAAIFGTWGIDNRQGKMLNIAFFSINLYALWKVLRGQEVKFNVTPKVRNDQRHLPIVAPQIAVITLTCVAIPYGGIHGWFYPEKTDFALLIVNSFWACFNAYCMTVLVNAALWAPEKALTKCLDVKNRITLGKTV
jgi:cellulose synthase (UDP-forming)